MQKILTILLATAATPAFAVTVNAVAPAPIPEPGAIALFGVGALAALVIRARRRNNKK